MNIGIIGAGALGSNAARLLVKSGVSATIANSRGPQSLSRLVGELGPSVKAGSVEEAASADMVLVAVRWVDLEKALGGLPAWNDRIVIDGTNPVAFLDPDSPDAKDPTNPLAAYGIKAIDLGGKHSSQVFRTFVPGARRGQGIQPPRRQRPARADDVGWSKCLILFGRRHQCEGRGPQASRTHWLFPGRPWCPRRRRTACVTSVRLACRH
jgi:NADP oxidoreductase coenzyme F420-dependent